MQAMPWKMDKAREAVLSIARAPLIWQLAAVGTIAVSGRLWLGSQDDVGISLQAWGAAAPFALVVLQASMTITPMGSSVIPVVNGMLFPLLLAVVLNLTGALAGGVGLYYVWRRGQRDLQIRERMQALPAYARCLARTDLRSLIIMRYVPYLGGNLANMLAGSHRVPLHMHILSVVIGSLPGSIIYALVGAGIIAL